MFGDVSAFCALGLIALTLLGVGVLPLLYLVVLGGREAPVRRVERLLKALAVPVRASNVRRRWNAFSESRFFAAPPGKS